MRVIVRLLAAKIAVHLCTNSIADFQSRAPRERSGSSVGAYDAPFPNPASRTARCRKVEGKRRTGLLASTGFRQLEQIPYYTILRQPSLKPST
eukprot:352114-Chlamydomonas_euryale.AAC.4